jgi:hypothetical protein
MNETKTETMNKKQTAVDWLAEQFDSIVELNPSQFEKINNAIEQAKQLEKEQMLGYIIKNYCIGEQSLKFHKEEFEKYYKETYEQE